ncbi:MAG: GNAT family N-acetyltransferase [Candidatus Krumholzibacteriia bacterium]
MSRTERKQAAGTPGRGGAAAGAAVLRDDVRPSDVAAVRDLVAATGFFSAEEVGIAAELVQEHLEKGAASGYEFLFAEVDGRVVGYTCYGLIPCSTVSWDVYWIAVDPDQQGSGLGRRLMAKTEDRARARGGVTVFAETSGRAQYEPTRGFYHRCGYHEAALLEDFYAVGDAKVIFARRL